MYATVKKALWEKYIFISALTRQQNAGLQSNSSCNSMHLLYHPNQQQPPMENFWQEGRYSHQGLVT